MSTARWNLKEAGGKTLPRGTRISLGITNRVRLPNKSKPKDYTDVGMYMRRGHGVKVDYLTTGGLMDVSKQSKKHGVKLAMRSQQKS